MRLKPGSEVGSMASAIGGTMTSQSCKILGSNLVRRHNLVVQTGLFYPCLQFIGLGFLQIGRRGWTWGQIPWQPLQHPHDHLGILWQGEHALSYCPCQKMTPQSSGVVELVLEFIPILQ